MNPLHLWTGRNGKQGQGKVLVKGVLPGLVLSLFDQVPSQSCVYSSYCEHC